MTHGRLGTTSERRVWRAISRVHGILDDVHRGHVAHIRPSCEAHCGCLAGIGHRHRRSLHICRHRALRIGGTSGVGLSWAGHPPFEIRWYRLLELTGGGIRCSHIGLRRESHRSGRCHRPNRSVGLHGVSRSRIQALRLRRYCRCSWKRRRRLHACHRVGPGVPHSGCHIHHRVFPSCGHIGE